ncbi:hypothetical protein [Ramlibacter alkalitolerans]|uniref:Uncharacterized protein n=1 Tax=Ramlibacter alkalitolerans TaxID=2039631 RepID=A0ABS1JVI8_9BURK|nr:hypothetical protein [Ramlibacter alkalitolerans]
MVLPSRQECLAARAGQAGSLSSDPGPRRAGCHLLLLREERLLEAVLRLPLAALGLLLLLRLAVAPLRLLLLLLPLEADPRLLPLLLREEDEPDFDEEEGEELRDAIACSFGGLLLRPSTSDCRSASRSI